MPDQQRRLGPGQHATALSGAVTDREIFLVGGGRIKFHLKFHTESGMFDAHSVKLHRQGAPDASCNQGDVLDVVIDELVKERSQFLSPP